MSKHMWELTGYNYEELLERASRCELETPFNDVEWLAFILDQLLETIKAGQMNSNVVDNVRYYNCISPRMGRPHLTRMHNIWKSDMMGRVVFNRFVYEPISPEAYDEALLKTPELCRPFMAAMGDVRTGQELTDQSWHDYSCGMRMSELAKTEQGLLYLDRFAYCIDVAFAPVYVVAGQLQAMLQAEAARNDAAQTLHQPWSAHIQK